MQIYGFKLGRTKFEQFESMKYGKFIIYLTISLNNAFSRIKL